MARAGQDKVKAIITERILEQLAQGVVPWHKPWVGVGASWNRRNGKPYGFMNQMLLDGVGEYATFNAIIKEGGKVNKGAKGNYVIEWFFKDFERTDSDGNVILDEDTGEPKKFRKWTLRYQNVFNIARDTNLEPKYHKDAVKTFDGKPIDIAENCFMHYINTQNITLEHADETQAFYRPSRDMINIPPLNKFEVVEEYYSTAFHEAAHSTGHGTRLDRLEKTSFGTKSYGKEELVAELTSAAICNTLGIEIESTFQNSASYIDNWTKAIKGGEADIISASSFADKAYELILDGFEYESVSDVDKLNDELGALKREYNERFMKYWKVDPWSGTGYVDIDVCNFDYHEEFEMFKKIEELESAIDALCTGGESSGQMGTAEI